MTDAMHRKRVAVIGAGASGLTAVKCCKEEGLEVICYEKTDKLGGRWCFRENDIEGVASGMKSTVSVVSKELIAFSDFPPPKDFPNYLQQKKMLEYLKLYALEFDLLPHIKYRHEVVRVSQYQDHSVSGKWLVTFVNKKTEAETTEEFDCVMVCSGRLSYPSFPKFPFQEKFRGIKIHTHSLKHASSFENMNVLVIGSGNSAVDAAVDISTVAKQVYLSVRRGFWVFPKLGPTGLPYDMNVFGRYIHVLKQISSCYANTHVEKYLDTKLNHEAYKIKPTHRAFDKPFTVNGDLPDKILTGRIFIKGRISSFQENGAVFENEESVTRLDAVIFGTGYDTKFPFLDDYIYANTDGSLNLYKGIFPMSLKQYTLAFIGFVTTQAPTFAISETQSRWAARLFAKKIDPPTDDSMLKYVNSKGNTASESFAPVDDYIEYMDSLAEEYGVKPHLPSLLFKDFNLFWTLFTGPFLSYQYRLVGPHTWRGAQKAILECHDRVKAPLEMHSQLNKFVKKSESLVLEEK